MKKIISVVAIILAVYVVSTKFPNITSKLGKGTKSACSYAVQTTKSVGNWVSNKVRSI